jgi:hypothetical protein
MLPPEQVSLFNIIHCYLTYVDLFSFPGRNMLLIAQLSALGQFFPLFVLSYKIFDWRFSVHSVSELSYFAAVLAFLCYIRLLLTPISGFK